MDKLFAAAVVLACVAMLVRLGLGERRRWRLAAQWRRWQARWLAGRRLPNWFANRDERDAERVARDAIRRARERAAGEWEGNVYKPKSFRGRQGKKNVH